MAAVNFKKSKNIVDSLSQRSLICPHERDYLQRVHLPNELANTDRLYLRDLKGHFGCVNSLCFSSGAQEYLASGGDDKRVLLWQMGTVSDLTQAPSPVVLKTTHLSNIFSIKFSCDNSYMYSAGNDGLILTQDLRKGDIVQTYQHIGPVNNVDAHPSSPRVIVVATDDGGVYLMDTRAPRIQQEMLIDDSIHPFTSVSINPLDPYLVATGNEYNGASLYDLRSWKKVMSYRTLILSWLKSDIMSVNFNSTGSKLCVLPKAEPPKLFGTLQPKSPEIICMDDKETYKNTVTLKTTCFAGDQDEYIVTGSDDFRLYWWKTKLTPSLESDEDPDTCGKHISTHMVIPGHKSIVNQVCYSSVYHTLVSSGVEKTIKVWTQFPLNSDHTPHMSHDPPARDHYSYVDLLSMSLHDNADSMSDSSENMEENGRSLAFFDYLIREENMQNEESSSAEESEEDDLMYPFSHMIRMLNHSPYSNSDNEEGSEFITYHRHSINFMDNTASSNEDEMDHERNSLCSEDLNCTCVVNYCIDGCGQDYEHVSGRGQNTESGSSQNIEQSSECGQDQYHESDQPHVTSVCTCGLGNDPVVSKGGVATLTPPIDNTTSSNIRQNNHYVKHSNTSTITDGGRSLCPSSSGCVTNSSNEFEISLKALRDYFTKSTTTTTTSSSGSPIYTHNTDTHTLQLLPLSVSTTSSSGSPTCTDSNNAASSQPDNTDASTTIHQPLSVNGGRTITSEENGPLSPSCEGDMSMRFVSDYNHDNNISDNDS